MTLAIRAVALFLIATSACCVLAALDHDATAVYVFTCGALLTAASTD